MYNIRIQLLEHSGIHQSKRPTGADQDILFLYLLNHRRDGREKLA